MRSRAPNANASRRHVTAPEQDITAVLVVTRARVLLATALVLGGSLLTERERDADVLVAVGGYLWVPLTAVLALVASARTVRVVRVVGAVGDLAMLCALDSLVDGASAVALAGYSLVVVLGAYTGGRQFGLALALGAILLVLFAESGADDPMDGSVIAVFGLTLALLLVVVDRAASEQRRAAAHSAHLSTKADAILAHVADGVVVTDAGGVISEANPAAQQLVGLRASVGRSCGEVLALCFGERELDCSNGCGILRLAAESPSLGIEVWRARPDGSRQPLLANASPLFDEAGELVEVVHSLRDITRLKQADEAKTLFLATASHELKTPLAVIRGFAETLQRDNLPDTVRERGLEAIAVRARELTGIVERLLLSSRIEAGRLVVETEPIDIAEVLHERVEAMAAATGRAVVLSTGDDPLFAHADHQAVATIVDHLIDNALKYSPGGEPVSVSLRVDETCVRIEVGDHGVGMDSEQAAHCFDKFWQADSTDRRQFGGAGIGLYIVASLSEGMGGRVEVRSELGAGSTFSVLLRRADVVSSDVGGGVERDVGEQAGVGERSMVGEFMRQIGVPAQTGRRQT